jgi:hypothetical protein
MAQEERGAGSDAQDGEPSFSTTRTRRLFLKRHRVLLSF